jgi:hypothetical protein
MTKLWVVGDKFASCSTLGSVVTLTDLWTLVEQIRASAAGWPDQVKLELGQGLSRSEIAALEDALLDPHLRAVLTPAAPIELSYPCDPKLVHKKNDRNVMLGAPKELSSDVYGARLRIDDACDDMADHQTGLHLAGALLAEAARQMVLAVSEAFLLPSDERHRMQFVTHSADMVYHTYAFPFCVDVKLSVQKLRRGVGGNFKASVNISFEQNAKNVADVRMQFSAMESAFVRGQEGALAKLALGVLQ